MFVVLEVRRDLSDSFLETLRSSSECVCSISVKHCPQLLINQQLFLRLCHFQQLFSLLLLLWLLLLMLLFPSLFLFLP